MKIVVFPGPGRRAEPGPFAVLRARGAFGWVRGALGWARGAFGLAAALVGSVIGAGFLSGAELVRFFPAQGILPHAAVAAGLFFLCFWMLYRVRRPPEVCHVRIAVLQSSVVPVQICFNLRRAAAVVCATLHSIPPFLNSFRMISNSTLSCSLPS